MSISGRFTRKLLACISFGRRESQNRSNESLHHRSPFYQDSHPAAGYTCRSIAEIRFRPAICAQQDRRRARRIEPAGGSSLEHPRPVWSTSLSLPDWVRGRNWLQIFVCANLPLDGRPATISVL